MVNNARHGQRHESLALGRLRRILRGAGLLAVLATLGSCGTQLTLGRPAGQGVEAPAALPDLDGAVGCEQELPAAACVQPTRLRQELNRIARPRPSGSPQHAWVQNHCAEQLRGFGYEVRLHAYGSGTNVVGRKLGFSRPHEVVVVGAHYDQLAGCAGADDNASGVAAALEVARVLAAGRFDRTLEVACWDEGERGWLGSAAHVLELLKSEQPRLALAFEAVAFVAEGADTQILPEGFERLWPDQALALLHDEYRARFLTVVTDGGAEAWAIQLADQARSDGLATHVLFVSEAVKKRQQAMHRADHSSFWAAKVPALLVTDTGRFRNPHIGCVNGQDAPYTLNYPFLTAATRAAVTAVSKALQPR